MSTVNHKTYQQTLDLLPEDNAALRRVCGEYHHNIQWIEKQLTVTIRQRGHQFMVQGSKLAVQQATACLKEAFVQAFKSEHLSDQDLFMILKNQNHDKHQPITIKSSFGTVVKSRGKRQNDYMNVIQKNHINFGIGPAGTGKTFLAVALAVQALERGDIERILLVRPAVEAGERLGFLPGDLSQKIDPYLRPLYDALHEMLGPERVEKLITQQVIEIAPLAYMRGRTLNHAMILLDESQNTTREQMKMFLTRIGFGSTAIINGDLTQVDLPRHTPSGLRHAQSVLKDVPGISFTCFTSEDVVRHPLVQKVIDAYEAFEKTHEH